MPSPFGRQGWVYIAFQQDHHVSKTVLAEEIFIINVSGLD